jgi:hypothetical protein
MYHRTCGLLELNSGTIALFIGERDFTSYIFQLGENKEGRERTMTEETHTPPPPHKKKHVLLFRNKQFNGPLFSSACNCLTY